MADRETRQRALSNTMIAFARILEPRLAPGIAELQLAHIGGARVALVLDVARYEHVAAWARDEGHDCDVNEWLRRMIFAFYWAVDDGEPGEEDWRGIGTLVGELPLTVQDSTRIHLN
jgi:hypothetical protein